MKDVFVLQSGGAVHLGLEDSLGSSSCAASQPLPTTVNIRGNSTFFGNEADVQGGAIAVQSGMLQIQASSLLQNYAGQVCFISCAVHP